MRNKKPYRAVYEGVLVYGSLIECTDITGKPFTQIDNGKMFDHQVWEVDPETVGQRVEFPASEDGKHTHCYVGDHVLVQSDLIGCTDAGLQGLAVYREGAFVVDFGDRSIPVWSDSYWLEVQGNIHEEITLNPTRSNH